MRRLEHGLESIKRRWWEISKPFSLSPCSGFWGQARVKIIISGKENSGADSRRSDDVWSDGEIGCSPLLYNKVRLLKWSLVRMLVHASSITELGFSYLNTVIVFPAKFEVQSLVGL